MDPDQIRIYQNQQHESDDDKLESEQLRTKINEGPWTLEQNKKYTFFMNYFKNIFVSKQRRKAIKIFRSLSQYLQTRNSRQCRSHYQKLMNKHRTISKLKKHFRNMIGVEQYDTEYKSFTETMDCSHKQKMLKQERLIEGKEFAETGVQTEGIITLLTQQNNINPNNWNTSHTIEDPSNHYPMFGFWSFFPQKPYIPQLQKQ